MFIIDFFCPLSAEVLSDKSSRYEYYGSYRLDNCLLIYLYLVTYYEMWLKSLSVVNSFVFSDYFKSESWEFICNNSKTL